jgi:lipoprotein-anchoring transpeptidase ErfK/SrfK
VSLPLPQEVIGGKQIASLLNVPTALNYGEFKWNEDGVPEGKTWVLVDLEAQTLSVFRGMNEIGTAVTLYGVDHKPTPLGRFKILEKRKDHRSNLYDASMPYMLRLTMDGVAIHGSDVREGAGTHGCLGVPLDFGERLFGALSVGDEVLIVRSGSKKRT